MYALGGVLLYLMTFQTSTELRYLIIGAVGACTSGAQMVAYAYCGQFYPMSIRSTGIGMASGVGRLGAIAAPLLIGQIVALELPLEQNFLVIGAFGIIGSIALAFIRHGGPASVARKRLHASCARHNRRRKRPIVAIRKFVMSVYIAPCAKCCSP